MAGLLDRFGPLLLRVTLLIPLVLSAISGILVSVTLSSGSSPGNLEDLAFFQLNLSTLNVTRGLQADNSTAPTKRDVIFKRQKDIFDSFLGGATASPPPPGGVQAPPGGMPAPPGNIAAPPGGVAPSPGGVAPPPGGVATAPGGIAQSSADTPPSSGVAPPSSGVAPTSSGSGLGSLSGLADLFGGGNGVGGAIGKALTDGTVQGLVSPLIQSVQQGVQSGLGVPQWVSLHPRTICNGDFTNSDPNAGVNVRSCTVPGKRPDSLGEVIGLNGPLMTLAGSLTLPKALNQANKLLLDGVNLLGLTLTVSFVFAAIFSFFAVLSNFIALIVPQNSIVVALNTVLSAIAATLVTAIFVGTSVLVTVITTILNEVVEDFQVTAKLGTPFLGVSIAATLLSLGAAGIWSIVFAVHFRETVAQLFKVAFSKNKKQQNPADPPEKSYMF